ncbi:hypothetical protein TGMAS_270630 [Toxoplasma gondii MAS]|uniref:Uncharacterized protein n=1 Tax=Toxoplasma gondii MAS TaxID=943118 RepID=A0A086QVL3_TOXGO|nr:hypothetical protein TGMAS_270630 [Toxoplasma gondii MAS]
MFCSTVATLQGLSRPSGHFWVETRKALCRRLLARKGTDRLLCCQHEPQFSSEAGAHGSLSIPSDLRARISCGDDSLCESPCLLELYSGFGHQGVAAAELPPVSPTAVGVEKKRKISCGGRSHSSDRHMACLSLREGPSPGTGSVRRMQSSGTVRSTGHPAICGGAAVSIPDGHGDCLMHHQFMRDSRQSERKRFLVFEGRNRCNETALASRVTMNASALSSSGQLNTGDPFPHLSWRIFSVRTVAFSGVRRFSWRAVSCARSTTSNDRSVTEFDLHNSDSPCNRGWSTRLEQCSPSVFGHLVSPPDLDVSKLLSCRALGSATSHLVRSPSASSADLDRFHHLYHGHTDASVFFLSPFFSDFKTQSSMLRSYLSPIPFDGEVLSNVGVRWANGKNCATEAIPEADKMPRLPPGGMIPPLPPGGTEPLVPPGGTLPLVPPGGPPLPLLLRWRPKKSYKKRTMGLPSTKARRRWAQMRR